MRPHEFGKTGLERFDDLHAPSLLGDSTMTHGRLLETVLVVSGIFVVAMAGCRRDEPVAPADDDALRTGPRKPELIESTAGQEQDGSARAIGLTERQERAIETILAAGGTIKQRDDGSPASIDLASQRVFADTDAVRAVLEFPGLKKQRLAVSGVSRETLCGLRTLTALDELLLQDAPVTDVDLAEVLDSMPALSRLTLRRLHELTNVVPDCVDDCPKLEVLALVEMHQISGASLDRLANMKHLRSLDLRNSGHLAAADYQKLSSLVRLTDLKIGGAAVDDEVLGAVARLPSLSSLSIEDAEISADGLQHIAEADGLAARLRSLSIARCLGVSDESLTMLDRLPQLETLALRDILLTGSFLTSLSETEASPFAWKTLIVTNAFLTDEEVALLPQLAPDLARLDLRGNVDVTDESLGVFERMPKLTDIQIEETDVSTNAIDRTTLSSSN
jgi:hypothetical protein